MKTKDQFVKATAVLVSGTALAHGITALSLPVLSRLYTPTDFSVLAVFSSILAIIAVAACLRFEIAIAIPQSEEEALGLLAEKAAKDEATGKTGSKKAVTKKTPAKKPVAKKASTVTKTAVKKVAKKKPAAKKPAVKKATIKKVAAE